MAHHKRRKRKRFVGCCAMCACRRFDMGVPHKRNLTPQELRAQVSEREQRASVAA